MVASSRPAPFDDLTGTPGQVRHDKLTHGRPRLARPAWNLRRRRVAGWARSRARAARRRVITAARSPSSSSSRRRNWFASRELSTSRKWVRSIMTAMLTRGGLA